MNVYEAAVKVVADMTQARQQIATGADEAAATAGTSAGGRFSGKFGTAVKAAIGGAIGAGLGVVAGLMLGGARDLNDATSKYAAETGASVAETKAAGVAISDLFSKNLQSMGQIGDVLTTLRTGMHLTGAEANAAAGAFLRYATATGQDAGTSTEAFRKILSAWNLTAKDAPGIMDMLVRSHEKYGGSVEANQEALVKLAPALQAVNMNVSDGIGFLNMATSAGVDAGSAAMAFGHAIKLVKSPEELQKFINKIRETKDPLERAKLSAELFGTRAGPKLAQALAQGKISDFKVSLQDAAGASDAAAAKIQGSFGNQFELLMHKAGAALASIGTNFGPLVIGFAALVPMLTPVLTAAGAALGGLLATSIGGGLTLGMVLLPVLIGAALAAAIIGAIAFIRSNPQIVGQVAAWIGNLIGNIVQFLGALPGRILAVVGPMVGQIVNAIVNGLKALPGRLLAVIGPAIGAALNFIAQMFMRLPGMIGGLLVLVVAIFIAIGIQAVSIVVSMIGRIVGFIMSIPGRIAALIGSVVGIFNGIAAQVPGIMLRLVIAVVQFILTIPGRIQGLVNSVVSIFGQIASRVPPMIATLVGQIVSFLFQLPGRLASLGGQVVTSIINGLSSLPGQLYNAIANAFQGLNFSVGPFHITGSGISVSLPHIDIPHLAEGAWNLPADTLAVLHKGEMVVPSLVAERIRKGAAVAQVAPGGGNTYIVQVQGMLRAKTADEIGSSLRRLGDFGILPGSGDVPVVP